MNRIIFSSFILIYLITPASAMVTPILYSDFNTSASNTATNYVALSGGEQAWGATEATFEEPIPVAGTLRNLFVVYTTAPGTGTSRTIDLRLNGANSTLTCQVSGAAQTSCSDTTHQIPVAAGNLVDYSSVPVGTPAASTVNIYVEYYSNSTRRSILLGGASQNVPAANTRYLTLMGMGNNRATNEINAQEVVSVAGTIKNLYTFLSGAPGAGKSFTFTVRQNGADTAISCVVTGTGTPASCSDNTHSITVAPGDLIDLSSVPTGSPTARSPAMSVEFDPDIDGYSMLGGATGTGTVTSRTANNYAALEDGCDSTNNFDATEANVQDSVPKLQLSNFYVSMASAPGAGNSYQLAIRKNNVTQGLSITISGATATTGNDTTDTVTTAAGDTADIISIPTSSPVAEAAIDWGMAVYVQPDTFDAKLLSGD